MSSIIFLDLKMLCSDLKKSVEETDKLIKLFVFSIYTCFWVNEFDKVGAFLILGFINNHPSYRLILDSGIHSLVAF